MCLQEKPVREAGWGSKRLVSAGVQPQPEPQGALGRELHHRVGHTLRQGSAFCSHVGGGGVGLWSPDPGQSSHKGHL